MQESTGDHRLLQSHTSFQPPQTNRPQPEQAWPTNSDDSWTENEQADLTKTFSLLSKKCSKIPCLSLKEIYQSLLTLYPSDTP